MGLFCFLLSPSPGFIQSNNVNNISAVCSASCFSSFSQSFEATGSKSALFRYEKPDLLCQWETICCVVSGLADNAISVCAVVHKRTRMHTHHPHSSVTWKSIWLWGINIFGRQNDDSQTRKALCSEAPYAASSVFSCSLFTRPVYSLGCADKLAREGSSVTLINLLASRGCLFASWRNYMMLFNFTSYLTITQFAWKVSNLFFSFPWLESYLPSSAPHLRRDDSQIHQVMVVFDGVHLPQP